MPVLTRNVLIYMKETSLHSYEYTYMLFFLECVYLTAVFARFFRDVCVDLTRETRNNEMEVSIYGGRK